MTSDELKALAEEKSSHPNGYCDCKVVKVTACEIAQALEHVQREAVEEYEKVCAKQEHRVRVEALDEGRRDALESQKIQIPSMTKSIEAKNDFVNNSDLDRHSAHEGWYACDLFFRDNIKLVPNESATMKIGSIQRGKPAPYPDDDIPNEPVSDDWIDAESEKMASMVLEEVLGCKSPTEAGIRLHQTFCSTLRAMQKKLSCE